MQNPTHKYNAEGTYTVTLIVSGPGGNDTKVMTDYITVGGTSSNAVYLPFVSR